MTLTHISDNNNGFGTAYFDDDGCEYAVDFSYNSNHVVQSGDYFTERLDYIEKSEYEIMQITVNGKVISAEDFFLDKILGKI